MFSSSYSANSFQQFPLPFTLTSPPPSSSIAHNDNFLFLHHHHQDLLSGHLFPANALAVDTFSTMAGPNKSSPTTINGVLKNPLPKIKKHVDKDKHRKIFTAQGPRHRRVRLSIGIARKFFDLQDLLGFDKASKTLDWLLNKSKTAITELEEHTKPPLSLSTDSESLATNEDDDDDNGESQSQSQGRVVVSKDKPLVSDKEWHFRDLRTRESRAKARARARERTREKMRNRKLKESEKASDSSLPMLSKSKSETTCDELGSYSCISLSTLKVDAEIDNPNYQVAPQDNQALKEEKMEESNVTKGKLEASSECNNYSPSLTQHGVDNSSSVTPSSFCAMTTMNPSRGFQIYGKSWEAYDNQRQG